ncbi:spermidine synthase [Mycena vulgaris]|nr:spermidine synthase [Mycena vulgaris]
MSVSWPNGLPGVACRLVVDFTVLLAHSLVLFVYERALIPLYGSGPTTYTLNSAVIFATLAAAAHPIKVSQTRTLLFAGILFSVAPLATYWVPVWTSRWNSPILGPIFTHFVVLVPLLSVLTTFVADINLFGSAASLKSRNPISYRFLAGVASFAATVGLSGVWAKVSSLNNASESQIFFGLAVAMFNIWIAIVQFSRRPAVQRKRKRLRRLRPLISKPLLLVVFNVFWWNTHAYTHPTFPLRIHSSVQSVTGINSSHSLLGGVWMGGKVATLDDAAPLVDSYGTPLGDSIYGTFVLQEAARLVNSSSQGASRRWERALIIGLGAGISATAFSRHGITTTIVEIDPAVYDAARLYFGLPDHPPENLFLEDARTWAARRRAHVQSGSQDALFDIVVHDCFSGGGVPEHIFTLEFWDDLKAALHPEGVLAVNFAGMIRSDASRMISQTLAKSFGTCRAFHDSQGKIPEKQYETELINLVFFCSPHTNPLTFRKARSTSLASLPSREVPFELLTGELEDRFILTDSHNPLGKLQDAQGHHHWSLMRQVLPDIFWETY